jgi:hypothetical protein
MVSADPGSRATAASVRVLRMASWSSKVTDDTACPEGRSISRLALQNPANPVIWGSSTIR